MRYLLLLGMLGVLCAGARGRPRRLYENIDSELDVADYEANNENSADDLEKTQDSNLEDRSELRGLEVDNTQNGRLSESYAPDQQANPISGHQSWSREASQSNAENRINMVEGYRGKSSTYTGSSDPNEHPESFQRLNSRDDGSLKFNRAQAQNAVDQFVKRNTATQDKVNEDYSFDSNDNAAVKNNDYSNDAPDQYPYMKQANSGHSPNRVSASMKKIRSDVLNNRNRRQTFPESELSNIPVESNNMEDADTLNTEEKEEETAIKRHIKKLSAEELEELLQTLSDDKKALLKKIMESDVDTSLDNISKREITKKALAVQENSMLENVQSDLNKIQGSVSLESESSTQSSLEPTEVLKQSDTDNTDNVKSSESSNSGDMAKTKIDSASNPDAAKLDVNTLSSNVPNVVEKSFESSSTSKSNIKREANSDNVDAEALFNDGNLSDLDIDPKEMLGSPDHDDNLNAQEDELVQLINNESQLQMENDNMNKRSVEDSQDTDLTDSIKSLEESFPNAKSYDEAYVESDMVPLVRVKRKNLDAVMTKRAAALLPQAKVAYVPYRAESEDDDSNEGNEFDDDGFYDRTANFGKIKDSVEKVIVPRHSNANVNPDNVGGYGNSDLTNNDIESDKMSIGSDTDSVLSGVEGVDDNLMYNGGARNKRDVSNAEIDDEVNESVDVGKCTTGEALPSASSMNAALYQAHDAFGPLSHSYEGEVSRFKRIRRVKPPSTPFE